MSKCTNCRWCYAQELICVNQASDFLNKDTSTEDTEECESFYHWDDSKNANKRNERLIDD